MNQTRTACTTIRMPVVRVVGVDPPVVPGAGCEGGQRFSGAHHSRAPRHAEQGQQADEKAAIFRQTCWNHSKQSGENGHQGLSSELSDLAFIHYQRESASVSV